MNNTHTFGVLPDGREVEAVTFGNDYLKVSVLTLGATIWRLEVEGRNVALGHPTVDDYLDSEPFFGQTVGRFANRIGNGQFEIDGVTYQLATNEGAHTLHGGPDGIFRSLWSIIDATDTSLELQLISPDGDQGFPGELALTAHFVVEGNQLRLRYTATTDAPTPVNITNHLYLNLDGEDSGDVNDATLQVNAALITEVGDDLIPTGRLVEAGPLDVRSPRTLRGIPALDHNFVIDADAGKQAGLTHHATMTGAGGLTVDVHSDRPGLQVFTADGFKGTAAAISGGVLRAPRWCCA